VPTTIDAMTTTALRFRALPSDLAERTPTSAARTDLDGAPLRCCLRDSRPGEEVVLVSAAPPGPQGAYVESGPVFVHARDCGGPRGEGYPDDWRTRRQVFRAYGHDGTIVGGEVVEPGTGQEAAAARLLADPVVAFVHTRNVVHGCYMLRIDRA
jgi:hypothetical protein